MIEIDEVSVLAGGEMLLAPVSARTEAGRTLIVRGSNRSGKSTLLRVLAGTRRPTTGSVNVYGEPVDPRDRRFRRRVSTMIGLPPMATDLTVSEHLRLVARTWFDDPEAASHVALGVADELGIDGLRDRFPHELSSGQTQLFGLALVSRAHVTCSSSTNPSNVSMATGSTLWSRRSSRVANEA